MNIINKTSVIPVRTLHHTTLSRFMEPPCNYEVIKDNFLAKGGVIATPSNDEVIRAAYKNIFRFIVNKGFKSVISFLHPQYNRSYCEEEIALIKRHNEISDKKITLKNLPCWGLSYNYPRLSDELVNKINKLEPPIYMHCLAGQDTSKTMSDLFLRADKQGKILY